MSFRQVFCFLGLSWVFLICSGLVVFWFFSSSITAQRVLDTQTVTLSLPSQVFDVKGRLITEFFGEEKRELISIKDVSKFAVLALLAREDVSFFEHNGFSFLSIVRAVVQNISRLAFSGASTLTQQLAGNRYANRRNISITRKIRELFWAFQLERQYSKQEILENYLNEMPFGHTTYGIEAASQFYFNKRAKELNPADASLLVVQLASPGGLYSPIRNPQRAMVRQQDVLDRMVELDYLSQEQASSYFQNYWEQEHNWSRDDRSNAYFERQDEAPYFSEYIREQIIQRLFGVVDLYKDGLQIYTTLDLDIQRDARKNMDISLNYANRIHFENTYVGPTQEAKEEIAPILDLLGMAFGQESLQIVRKARLADGRRLLERELLSIADLGALIFNQTPLHNLLKDIHQETQEKESRQRIEGAFVTLEQNTGHIKAMIGGSRFTRNNQFNRVMYAQKQPGSSYKPLYYVAALEDRVITPATILNDVPRIFFNPDGTPYAPVNFQGRFTGPVTVRYALANSLNIPALLVLDKVGFDRAIDVSTRLLGIIDPQKIRREFPLKYPLGLGVASVTPIQMAKAFATIAHLGQEVSPIALRYVEDRNGKIVLNLDQENFQRMKEAPQIISPQAAYVLTDILESTPRYGTLWTSRASVDGFDNMPAAGKTGTTQNWASGWAVLYSPYYTTLTWFGFDVGNQSLGSQLTGATLAGRLVARHFKAIHQDLEPIPFPSPKEGLAIADIDRRTGLIPSFEVMQNERDHVTMGEVFIKGTEPQSVGAQEEESISSKISRVLLRKGRLALTQRQVYEELKQQYAIPPQEQLIDWNWLD